MKMTEMVQTTTAAVVKAATEAVTESSNVQTTTDYYDYDGFYDYYNYTYVYDETINHLPLREVVPMSLLYAVIGLLGLVGNLLVIFAIVRVQRMRSITNLFLLSLASADLLLVIICVPVKGIAFYSYAWRIWEFMCKFVTYSNGIAFYSYTWRLGEFMCKFVTYIQHVSMICSALTLTVMSIERFVAIRHPLKARSVCTIRHARFVIITVWVWSFILATPSVFAIMFRTVGRAERPAHWCHKHWTDREEFGKAYELYMLFVILLLPVVVMVTTYTWIATIIWNVATRRADMRAGRIMSTSKVKCETQQSAPQALMPVIQSNGAVAYKPNKSTKAYTDDDSTRKQVVLMLMVVVILFAFCWTPILVNNVLIAFGHMDYLHMGYLRPLRMVFHILSYANSCVNPFVYAFMSKNFRDGFKQSICACVRGEQYLRRKMTSMRSMTSTTRASASVSAEKMNVMRVNSAARRPSDMEDVRYTQI